MKTAISIPDKVFLSAEKLANQLGKTRSQLYTQAVSSYVAKHQADDIVKKLNEVYDSEDSSLDPELSAVQHNSIPKEEW
jgi:metal-responsive CopG/Arc/MetJ family transcriptional regulator